MEFKEGDNCRILGARCKIVDVATKYVSAKRLDDRISIKGPISDFRLLTN